MSEKGGASLMTRGRRGMLPLYVLSRLSRGPASGYDLMTEIDSMTEGSWRPGSGSIYPVLRTLLKKNLIEVSGFGDRSKRLYTLTKKGVKALEESRLIFDKYALERWHTIRGIILSLVSPESLARMMNETIEMQEEAWEKVFKSNITREDKLFLLKQHKLLLERHSLWIDKKIVELSKTPLEEHSKRT
ncbi:MAG: PadR family transcriptional regulator [Thermoprotei archaeon]